MATVLQPWQVLFAAMAGWISREQDAVAECFVSIAAPLRNRFRRYSEPQHRSAQLLDSTVFSPEPGPNANARLEKQH
jgi:hypothetical protein